MIESISIERLRGIRQGKLDDLTPLTILVGPNGCGKSTLLDAMLVGAGPELGAGLTRAIRRHSGVRERARWFLWKGGREGGARVTVGTDQPAKRTVSLEQLPDQRNHLTWRVDHGNEEIVRGSYSQSESRGDCPSGSTSASGSQSTGSYSQSGSTSASGSQSTGSYFQGESRGDCPALPGVSALRLIEDAAIPGQRALHEHYSDANAGEKRDDELRNWIGEVLPGARNLKILSDGEGFALHVMYDNHTVPAALEGDGIRALLRITLQLLAHDKGVFLLEEPEVHQHPGAMRQTVRGILEGVRRGAQVILTTHSLELIDMFLAEAIEEDDDEKRHRREEEIDRYLSVFSLVLKDGVLKYHRKAGTDVRFLRTQIEGDLR